VPPVTKCGSPNGDQVISPLFRASAGQLAHAGRGASQRLMRQATTSLTGRVGFGTGLLTQMLVPTLPVVCGGAKKGRGASPNRQGNGVRRPLEQPALAGFGYLGSPLYDYLTV
jgi:hypothetical protein